MIWSSERKVQAGFALALACLAVIGVVSYLSVNRQTESERWVRHTGEVIRELQSLLAAMAEAEAAERGYVITGDETYLEPYRSSTQAISDGYQRLRNLTADNPRQQQQLDILDPLILKSLRDTLEADGHHVTAAEGGQAGIDAFLAARAGAEPYHVVIKDLGMPHVDGRKVASAVKSTAPEAVVLMLTGWGRRLVEQGDIPAHVDRVLSKPPRLRELRQALELSLDFGTSRGARS
jgi:CheY-like chemotaxis protein